MEWIFIAPKKGMQVFLESVSNGWLIYKEGTAGIGGGGWHHQYTSEISGHILEPYEGSSSQAHTFNLSLNPSLVMGDTDANLLKTFEVTSFHATFRTQTTGGIAPSFSQFMGKAKAVLLIDGSEQETTRILDTDFFEANGFTPTGYQPYALVSKTGLSLLVEPGEQLALKVYDMTYIPPVLKPENLGFSVHIREVQP